MSNKLNVPIAYDDKDILASKHLIKARTFVNTNVASILNYMLQRTNITYKVAEGTIILFKKADPIRINGKVLDETGEPLPGVNIAVKGTSVRSITNLKGEYSIAASSRNDVLVFTSIGFTTKEVLVGVQLTVDVKMTASTGSLNEVVVTALGIKREAKALSYSQQKVDVELLSEIKSPNFINSLSGKIAGLQVVPAGFNTGSARVVIRGNNSLTGNNQPLFVVDGMPIDNTPGDAGSLDYGNNAADINPNDIENLEVLKGPNAAALYGSRAANGVILITTKKGSGKFKVSFNSNLQFQRLTELPEYQNAYGVGTSFYIDNTHTLPVANVNYRSWGSPLLGQPYVALNGETKAYLPQPDNVKDFYSTAHLFTNSLALEGGNAGTTYRLSYTNYDGTSVVEGLNTNKSHNIDLRLTNALTKRITFDTKITYNRNTVNNRQYSNSNGRNPTNLYTQMARSTELSELLPYKDPLTGMEIGTHRNFSNPYWVINENPNEDTKDRLIAAFNPQVTITPWLKFVGRLGADIFWRDGFEFNNIGSVVASNPNGFMRAFNTKQQNFNLEGFFTVNKKTRDFSFNGVLGSSSFRSGYEDRQQRVNSLLQPGFINLSNAKELPTVTQTIRKKQINSVYGSLSVGYHNYAFVDVTGRNDWSSTLPKANNSYFYPSLGGSLILTDMLKLKSGILSYAKLRASVAHVGNDADPYRLNQTYSFNGFFDGAPLASLSTTMNNPDLKPEKTSSFEYGVDLNFFNSRLVINATHYKSATTNQILTAQLPASSGYQQRVYNAGEVKNWGNELSASIAVIKKSKFTWQTNINYSNNKSMVVSLIDGVDRFVLNNNSSYIYVYAQVGQPYAYLRGLGVARDAQGHMLIDDGGGLLTKDNDMAFGTASPKWLGGISNTFTYRNFTLNCLIDIKKGGVIYSGTYSRMLTNGVTAETLYGRDDFYKHSIILGENSSELSGGAIWDAYYANGKKNTQYISPQSYEYARPNYAEFVMFDASYVKLRELSLGYNIPVKLLSRTPLKTARFSLVGRNLAIFHKNTPRGIDPEAASTSGNGQGIENGSLPPNTTYGFNVNLTF
ncbi:SusC/RagA family TonB-linked outer membrane protein [Mucilaginibacter terrae]|uniref:SusC/RagA family TonB-linked outer membrane protein n=1 Tax=Mucilaginibacter terrae TaxID=1955052 RepID=UPI00289D9FA1|nr:SusC/RagA family TonB-linked outer membrane protein [Mucilaginibacter terrae]